MTPLNCQNYINGEWLNATETVLHSHNPANKHKVVATFPRSQAEDVVRVAREEIFGPVVALIEVSTFEDAIAILNDTKYGLSSSIYTRDINRAFAAMRDIEADITYINGPTISAEVHRPNR